MAKSTHRPVDTPRIVILGSGNVATHLARALSRQGKVEMVCSRHLAHAQALASQISDCKACDSVADIPSDADFYIIAVADDQVAAVSNQMPDVQGIVAHTSGSVPIDALARHTRRGVFYPLQTFSKDAKIDIAEVPFMIEASDAATAQSLKHLAAKLSHTVIDADSTLRSHIHVAAVFACNFPNFMWTCAAQLLKKDNLDLSLMRPLLHATLDKALDMGPEAAQTGPARRGDLHVIEKHVASLPPDLASLYQTLTRHILDKYTQQ